MKFVYNNKVKGDTAELLIDSYFNAQKIKFTRQEPTGVNHPNPDFIAELLDILLEVKNWIHEMSYAQLIDKVLPKFLNTDPRHQKNWALVVPRITPKAKKKCHEFKIQLILTEKQVVTKGIWKNSNWYHKRHSTYNKIRWLQKLNEVFNEKGGSINYTDEKSDFKRLILEFWIVADHNNHFIYSIEGGKLEKSDPILGIGICEHCGRVFERVSLPGRFCSIQCYNKSRKKWGGYGGKKEVKNRE